MVIDDRHYTSAKRRIWPDYVTGCWNWTGNMDKDGYGRVAAEILENGVRRRGNERAHRFFYRMRYGPQVNQWVLHKCDNRLCCNPDHMFVGDSVDNTRDRTKKARDARGERHGNAKLTEEMVRLIRNSSLSSYKLAPLMGVSTTTIKEIRKGTIWRHVI